MELVNSKRYLVMKEFFLYGIIGGASATLDSVSYLFFRHLGGLMYLSNFISINLGITLSFLLNTYYNFKKTDFLLKRAISFYSIGYGGLLISMLLLWLGNNIFKMKEMLVKLGSVLIVAVIQFILNKIISFGVRVRVGANG